MEDTITYVDEPERFDAHLADLDKLERLKPARILPSHGDPDVIAAGGYRRGLVRATQQYIRVLERCRTEPRLHATGLRELIAGPLEAGWIHYFAPYEAGPPGEPETRARHAVAVPKMRGFHDFARAAAAVPSQS